MFRRKTNVLLFLLQFYLLFRVVETRRKKLQKQKKIDLSMRRKLNLKDLIRFWKKRIWMHYYSVV